MVQESAKGDSQSVVLKVEEYSSSGGGGGGIDPSVVVLKEGSGSGSGEEAEAKSVALFVSGFVFVVLGLYAFVLLLAFDLEDSFLVTSQRTIVSLKMKFSEGGRLFDVSATGALLSSVFFPFLFVGSLYIWGNATFRLGRNHPTNIKRRIVSIAIVCVASLVYMKFFAIDGSTWGDLLEWMGVRSEAFLASVFLPLLLTMILFAGPLTMDFLDGDLGFDKLKVIAGNVYSLECWRNYVVGPVAEEWVFRACICPLLLCGGFSFGATIISSPLLFGLAHAHHFVEAVYVRKASVKGAAFETIFQLFYTTIFGMYSAFLFVRTGHIIGPIVAHAFCNMMGFPAFHLIVGHEHQNVVALAFVGGLVGFFFCLYPLTTPSLFGSFFIA